MIERVILVGFMCSGKTTVGRLLAGRLGWEFIDFDDTIERDRGERIADIFRDRGEGLFRELETDLTERVQDRRQVVLATGGGWVTQPGLVDGLRPASLLVWLRVRPETVLERDRGQPDVERPLLASDEPCERIRSLIAARSPFYQKADAAVDTDDRDPDEVAAEIVAMLDR